MPKDPALDDIPVRVGDVLAGKYRVERVLGIGGMGVVVAAHHVDLNELRALKFLLPEAQESAETVERFMREARAVVKLKSPHIVQVFDVGRFDTGEPYIVMEHLAGEDLKSVLDSGRRIPISEAVDIVLQALEAMAEAHAAGIVHRDIKPANLFLTRDRDGGICVKVLDFGISKLITPGEDIGMEMTTTHALMGSPYYMSPEQMMSTRDVDERTDIWSIGVVLYQMITGRVPFRGKNIAAQCALLLQKVPPRPSERARDPLPPGLDDAIMRFLEREPEDRFQTTAAAAKALVPFGGPLARRALARVERALRESTLDRSNDDLVRPRRQSLADAVAEVLTDDDELTRSVNEKQGTLPWGADIGNDRTVASGEGKRPSDAGALSPAGGAPRASASQTGDTLVHPGITGPQRPLPPEARARRSSLSDLEAASPIEAMSSSTKASWQTMSTHRDTRRGRLALAVGAAAAVFVGAAVAASYLGGHEAPVPASSTTPDEPAPVAPPEPETPTPPAADPAPAETAPVEETPTATTAPTTSRPVLPPRTFPRTTPPSSSIKTPPAASSAEPPKPAPKEDDPFGSGRH